MRRVVPFSLAGALALGMVFGCGDSGGPGSTPASVTGIAGDGQFGAPGAQLTFPLSFIVLNGNGDPLGGVSVTWSVTPVGGASFNPPTGPTDGDGMARTTVTLGTAVGNVVILGTVQGLQQPVTYHAEVLDPCGVITAYTLGETVSGALSTTDCNILGYYNDFYQIDLAADQQSLRINQTSTAIDSWVELYRVTGELIGFHDDIIPEVNKNSQLDVVVVPGGSFAIAATSWGTGEVGAYTLRATQRVASFDNCGLAWVTRGVTVTDSVRTTDCADTAGGTDYYDFVALWLDAGDVLTVTQRSTELNPRLELHFGDGALLVANDDSATGTTDAFISFTVDQTGPYVILPGTSAAGETGAYTLELAAAPTPSAPVMAGAPVRELLRFGPVRLPKGSAPLPRRRGTH
ncbi:MAG: Ig-like domain-containing protein [Gemmatimonadales bacterium]